MLRITKQADYGIVLLTYFVHDVDRVLTTNELAGRSRLPRPSVSKILKLLARGGILASQRGANGGYRLSRSAEAISVEEIITALEGPIALTLCSSNADGCERGPTCPARPSWRRIDEAIRTTLRNVSLAEMAQSQLVAAPDGTRGAAGAGADYAAPAERSLPTA